MIHKLLATTALAMLFASGAFAQEATTPAPATENAAPATPAAPVVKADGQLASNIVGESVYNGTGSDAERGAPGGKGTIAGESKSEPSVPESRP